MMRVKEWKWIIIGAYIYFSLAANNTIIADYLFKRLNKNSCFICDCYGDGTAIHKVSVGSGEDAIASGNIKRF